MALDDDMALLARQPLLSLMERDALRLLAFAAESRILRAGDVLFRSGEPSDGAIIVVSGAIAITTQDDGQPASEIIGPGAMIGELALFTSLPRQVTAIAREPTQIMRLPRSVMRRVLGESPDSAEAIMAVLGDRLRGFVDELSTVQQALGAIDHK
ncbi:cAMP-binding proteins - catabolite gene activator and regulatory subunit of cAMP-dependent protein kinases [Hyphomicrobiales bacterium]|nr:cAMP-binding proteins - catabolite gene activator and regulatory subunit of cAMP-dependent protein kinases [Hyphomicrobiales bacterium]CAH1698242.1 cAMP-binding proteins - catabolite gene activator and regulatory subunit of cAMP-dependent protein kinases [Hyphomicrobiales bacterium]CAI0347886.1 Cyclic nucleotide-binding domain-containing protein [Hyphomicrobiales bacterium]